MARPRPSLLARLGRFAIAVPLVLLAVAAVLPEIGSDRWWIRYPEFPRLQFLLATLGLLALWAAAGGLRGRAGTLVALLALAGAAVQGFHLAPFTPLAAREARAAAACSPERTLRVLSANLQAGNRNGEAAMEIVRSADADIVLLLETDAWWDERIAALHEAYPFHVQSQPRAAHYYGMQLLSRLPLADAAMLYLFDEATPNVEALVTLRDGTPVRFLGLHPRPPLSEPQPTTLRDASIAAMAQKAAGSAEPVVMAGDLNAVPWASIVRLAHRVGRLEDPRVGRGFIASFDAESAWMRWPLDHILVQDAFAVRSFERLGDTGSDHYPVAATLCLEPATDRREPAPIAAGDRAAIEAAIAAARPVNR